MPRKALTPEQIEARTAALAAGRATAMRNRARLAAAPPEDIQEMPAVPHDIDGDLVGILISDQGEGGDFGEVAYLADPVELDAFGRFLAAQDAETRELLTDAELRVIFDVETMKALAAKKEASKKAATERAKQAAQANAGLISPTDAATAAVRERNARKVRYTPDLPEAGNSGEMIDVGFRVDGRVLFHGQSVIVTYAEYLSLREQEYRAKQAELDFEGRNRLSHLRKQAGGLSVNLNGAPA